MSTTVMSPFQEYIHLSRYSRFLSEKGRRETWDETVARYFDFFQEKFPTQLNSKLREELEQAVLNLEVMPSMRCMMTAGPALDRENISGYNCAYLAIDSTRSFSEILYILMNGTGVGFSVERQYVNKLPEVPEELHPTDTIIVVGDSKIGWARALDELISMLFRGSIPKWDVSKIRPAGSVLKTFGGRASGPEPLLRLFKFVVEKFQKSVGQRLTSIDCHDIACMIGECVVVGGVRRSALLSLSNLSDDRMRNAKIGQWYTIHPWRSLANNSAVYNDKQPPMETFMTEWKSLYDSKSGERGIFSRHAAKNVITRANDFKKTNFPEDDNIRLRNTEHEFGCNPCVTGDTMVAVADGRGYVSFKELAESGNDVPVYCLDDAGIVRVETMRRPKRTLKNAKVYKITLDDGSTIRATSNHRFYLRDGSTKTLEELKRGDSLKTMTKFDRTLFNKKNSSEYTFVKSGTNVRAEHRVIAEHHYDVSLLNNSDELTVHHIDFDSKNNSPKNLRVMSVEKKLSESTREENNPRYSGISNEELKLHARDLTKKLGRKASLADWNSYALENGLPRSFSSWRKTHLGDVTGFLKLAALELKLETYDGVDARIIKRLEKYLSEGYDCFIDENGQILFNKVCEFSGEPFVSEFPEKSVKSEYAQAYYYQKRTKEQAEKTRDSIRRSHAPRKSNVREEQARVYSDIKFELGKDPSKIEWFEACKKKNISTEISRPTSPFRSYDDLREYASTVNHKVVSVEFDGFEDVYNGTVDEYHNYFMGKFVSEGEKIVSILSANCSEIILRSAQMCNLSEVVIKAGDSLESLENKVRLATILGTLQSSLVNFRFLGKKWKNNTEDERLLGVSLTGIMDNRLTSGKLGKEKLKDALTSMRKVAIATNRDFSKSLGIEASTAITTLKPSGTVSSLVDSAPGIHARYSPYYIRRVRSDKKDPLAQVMIDAGIPHEQDVMRSDSTWIFSFPTKSPKSSMFIEDFDAVEQLETWLLYQMYWTDHKPSVTINVKEHEWMKVGAWVYDNFDWLSGVSFLPFDDNIYEQPPYEKITEEEYNEFLKKMPKEIDWSLLKNYENSDMTEGSQELACVAGGCVI